ncbi:MAG TPA: hypothetical protein VHE13_09935 [Opitutus sp.]|nr:hypothetical protein [Opitutus sp.]
MPFLHRFRALSVLAGALVFVTSMVAQQNWRWANMLPASEGFKKVAFGNNLYVAVGDDSTIVTSPDAVNWTVRRMSTNATNLNSVAFGNGLFVAVGMGAGSSIGAGLILTSPDGVTWTTNQTIADTYNAQFSDVIFGNGLFVVAGAAQNRVLTSPDGLTWTPRNAGYNTTHLAYGGGRFIATAGGNRAIVSTDGITWTTHFVVGDANTFTVYYDGIAYGAGKFVLAGRDSNFNTGTFSSTDGEAWTPGAAVADSNGGASWIAFASDVFVMAGNGGLFSSPDGNTWTKRTSALPPTRSSTPGSLGTENIGGVAAANGTLFVLGSYGSITTSTDGATWTRQSTGTAQDINGLVYDGTRFVGVGTGGTVITSPDGTTWTASPTNRTGWFGQLAYANGHYVTAGLSGGYYSTDLATWTYISGTNFNQMFGVIHANGLFVAANNALSLGVYTSPDGEIWTNVKPTGLAGQNVAGLAGGGGSFAVTTGGFGATPRIFSSADGATWLEHTPDGFSTPDSLAYGNGRYVLLTSSQTQSWTSPDGVTWTAHDLPALTYLSSVKFVGSNFVARATVNNIAVLKISSDGVTWTDLENSRPPNSVFAAMVAKDNLVVAVGGGGAILLGDLAGAGTPTPPASQAVTAGEDATFTVSADGAIQWLHNGAPIGGATSATLTVPGVQPADAGLYSALVINGDVTALQTAILGLSSSAKVIGAGTVVGSNVPHPNGNIFDQVLITGAAETITADAGQITRTSYIDLDDDIVQIEFSGAGTLSVVLDDATGPAHPLNYNQDVDYMKGHAGIVIVGANETTNVSVFTVGRATAFDLTGHYNILLAPSPTNDPATNGSPLFSGHADTPYDGIADIAFIAIASTNGKFGGIRTANANYFASRGLTGVYAPGVQFVGPVFIGNLSAHDEAIPAIILGSATDTRITGGDLLQANGAAVEVSGITQLKFTAGSTSAGTLIDAQNNQATLVESDVDITDLIVVNPAN